MDRLRDYLLCLVLMTMTVMIEFGAGEKWHQPRPWRQPHIILFMADDTGYADHQQVDPTMRTPALMALEKRGIVVNQSYTLQTCTPTRSALLTGRYPYKMGMQIGKIKGTFLRWLDVRQKLLPASLKELGYTTHAVGKWHLGFCNVTLTPRGRGFDTFYGFYSGAQGYFNHSGTSNKSFDFRDNGRVVWEAKGHYSTELHTTRVQEIIRNHSVRNGPPFFIYMAYQNAHAPFEAKQWYVDKYCNHVKEEKRCIHCAMVAAMDESIGNISKTLQEKGLTKDIILIYLSDNGGVLGHGSYNWPLRGGKSTFWEGGMRSRTIFVYPARMKRRLVGTVWNGLFHVTDWYPTLYRAAGGNVSELQEMDGIDQLDGLLNGTKGQRTEMIYNIDPTHNRSAVRIGNFKLLTGKPARKQDNNGRWAPSGIKGVNSTFMDGRPPNKQLFNIRRDPTESKNLLGKSGTREKLKPILKKLEDLLDRESKKVIPFPEHLMKEPAGNPELYGGVWAPGWCDPYRQDPY